MSPEQRPMTSLDLSKGSSVLTLQNHVNNLTAIRSVKAGTLTARALATVRAAVAGVAFARTVTPTPDAAPWADHGLRLMPRGVERC
jgi:hypothetical protein